MMMKLYLDTEFNGFGGDLISMALVGETFPHSLAGSVTSEFYHAVLCKAPIDPWVQEHVMPHLNAVPLMPYLFRAEFHDFIKRFANPEIICDWHADAEHFCRMLAGPDYGTSLDFACRITILNTPPGQPVSEIPHNAMEDARALKRWHQDALRSVA